MSEQVVVGIDLGTTNSVIARVDAHGRPAVVPNAEGKNVTPSVVQLRADGSSLVGEAAKHEIALEKEHTACFFKRDMGTAAEYRYHGKPYTPTDLSAEVLRKLKRDAEAALGHPVRRAVITVPAYFQDGARIATRAAGELAGLEVVQMVNEPTAAAIAYGVRQTQRDETVLVYDLGGGTFDVTLVRVAPDAIEVIGTDGNHNLGGKDWDDRIVQHVSEEFRRRTGADPLDEPYLVQELSARAEEAKKRLSEAHRAAVPVNCGGRMERVEITRDTFEAITRDLLAQTEGLVRRLLGDCKVGPDRLAAVLMVGGSTRMPSCAELVQRVAGRPPNTTLHPDECVALGAAILATEYASPADRPPGLARRRHGVRDVMSHSMGMIAVSADGARYVNSVLIPKNRPIPCREVRPYQVRTRERGANAVTVFVTQGEGEDPSSSSFVGKYSIRGVTHVPDATAVLDIGYAYDRSGVVTVAATERHSGRDLEIVKEQVPEDMSWVHGAPRDVAALAHQRVFLAVDLSGSMSGTPTRDAQAAMRAFVASSDLAHTSIGLISFADRVAVDCDLTQDARLLEAGIAAWSGGGSVGGCNSAHPFDEVLRRLGDERGPRVLIVLTDGVWSCKAEAERAAGLCAEAGIEVIARGFGSADEAFLRRIASAGSGSLCASSAALAAEFTTIAQVLVERDGLGLRSAAPGAR